MFLFDERTLPSLKQRNTQLVCNPLWSVVENLKSRGRQRSVEVQEAVLTATFELMRAMSLQDLTIEAIAKKAGVAKTTIYKWWPSKAHVALDAFRSLLGKEVAIPDTGDISQDLLQFVRSAVAVTPHSGGRIFGQFACEAFNNPTFAAQFREALNPRRVALGKLLELAVEREQVDRSMNTELVIDSLLGPLFYRMMMGHNAAGSPEEIVSIVMKGIEVRKSSNSKSPSSLKR